MDSDESSRSHLMPEHNDGVCFFQGANFGLRILRGLSFGSSLGGIGTAVDDGTSARVTLGPGFGAAGGTGIVEVMAGGGARRRRGGSHGGGECKHMSMNRGAEVSMAVGLAMCGLSEIQGELSVA